MPTEPENTRSAAFTPQQLAQVTEMTTSVVREMMASLMPVISQIALTPEKIREFSKPYVDPLKEKRNKREMALFKEDEDDRIKRERSMKDMCRHLDPRGQTSIRLIRNFYDRQPRGVCMLCNDLIHPKEWRIGPPDDTHPRGRAYICEPHKDYPTVLHISARE